VALPTVPASPAELLRFPVPARPRIDPADVVVPAGYRVSVVLAGLSFPTGMAVGRNGSVYVLEGGSTWPTRPYLPARVLRLDGEGRLTSLGEETLGGPRGAAVHDGALYLSDKGGHESRIVRYDLGSGERTVVVDGLPDGGWHEPGGPVFGPDGLMYRGDRRPRRRRRPPDLHIPKAREPFGSVIVPDWYGFPDICGDGLPAWHDSHRPSRGKPAMQLIADPPPWAGPAAYLEKPHSCMTKMDFCRSDAFGHRGRLFACEWGTLAPMNSPRREDLEHGFKVISVDVRAGTAEDFVRNDRPGPASALGTGGIERPVDCAFAPDGRSLYVLDFGVARVEETTMLSFARTGVLWRITGMTEPDRALLLELDDGTRVGHLDRVATWLVGTRTLQTAYRKLCEDTDHGLHDAGRAARPRTRRPGRSAAAPRAPRPRDCLGQQSDPDGGGRDHAMSACGSRPCQWHAKTDQM
jgi:hypothetical protein